MIYITIGAALYVAVGVVLASWVHEDRGGDRRQLSKFGMIVAFVYIATAWFPLLTIMPAREFFIQRRKIAESAA